MRDLAQLAKSVLTMVRAADFLPPLPDDGSESLDLAMWHTLLYLQAIVDKLPKTADGVLFDEYIPAYGTTAWCVYRHSDDEPWQISKCHSPEDSDEVSMSCDWIVENAEDECEAHGVYSTLAAAEAAMKEASG